jgi:hypothetical protein
MFYLSHQCQLCHNIQCFGQYIAVFLERSLVYQLFHLFRIDTDPDPDLEIMRIRPDPDPNPQHCLEQSGRTSHLQEKPPVL